MALLSSFAFLSPLFLLPFPFSRRRRSLLTRCIVFPALQIRHCLIPIFLLCTPHRTSQFLGLLRPSPELGFLDIPRGSDTPIWSIDARFYPFMEATAAARGASLTMHSPQLSRQEWRAVADNHSARDAADEVGLPSSLFFFSCLSLPCCLVWKQYTSCASAPASCLVNESTAYIYFDQGRHKVVQREYSTLFAFNGYLHVDRIAFF